MADLARAELEPDGDCRYVKVLPFAPLNRSKTWLTATWSAPPISPVLTSDT